MKRILMLLIVLAPLVALAEQQATKEFIIWTDDMTVKDFQVESVGGTKVRALRNFNGQVARMTPEQAAKLKAKGLKVEENHRVHVMGKRIGVESTKGTPWGITAIQAPKAQKLKKGSGDGVVVCVVDTGIDYTHPALKGAVIGGDAIVKTTAPGKKDYFDDMGHGTHVSGTIAGRADGLLGVAPKSKLYAIKVLDADGSGSIADVADGIKACIGHGKIINMSLGGGGFSQAIQDALDAAVKAGIQIACAAGNDPGPVEAPANQKGCQAVSAVDVKKHLASFSASGKEVAFAAPGVGVKSSTPGDKYETWDGTSMATPHVAGTMAVELSRKKSALKGKSIGLPSDQQGAGEINAYLTAK